MDGFPLLGMVRSIVKPFDYVLIIVICAAIAVLSFSVYHDDTQPFMVSVKTESGLSLYRLDQNRRLAVKGPIGTTLIEIVDAEVRVVSSPCRDKLCVLKGTLKKNGDWTACMPNRVYVSIQGKVEEGLDEFSY